MTLSESHLSPLVLDEVACGAAPAREAVDHAARCPECGAALSQRALDAAALQTDVGYRRTLARLEANAASRGRWWGAWSMAVAAAICAGLLVSTHSHRPNGSTGIKGGTSLELVGVGGARVTGPVRVGERVALQVGSGGAREAMVLAIDGAGRASRVWPPMGDASAPLPAPGISVLSPGFVVTPGSLVLVALLSDQPLSASSAIAAFEGRGAPRPEDLSARSRLPGEVGRAVAVLCVEGEPCSSRR